MGKITPDFIRLRIRTTILQVRNTVGCIQNDVDKNKIFINNTAKLFTS